MTPTGWSAFADHDRSATARLGFCLFFGDRLLTSVTDIVTLPSISFTEGPFARVLSKVERGRSPRADLQPAPGRLRVSFTPVLRPVREMQSLDWDRRRRVTPARATSQEAWPGVEPAGRKPLARAAVERRKARAPEASASGNIHRRGARRIRSMRLRGLGAFRRSASLLFLREDLGRAFLQREGKARMHRRIARTGSLYPPPRSGGGGPREAWWRGLLSQSFVAVAEEIRTSTCNNESCVALRPAPPPPRKSAVPLPRFHGGG